MARAKKPKVDFFHGDFRDGVRLMSREEIGDYILLLCAIWDERDWTIPYDVEPLHVTLHCRRADVRKRVERLIELKKIFVGADGRLHNDRADRDRADPGWRTRAGAHYAHEESLNNSARLPATSPQLALNLAATSAEVEPNLRPNGAINEAKSTAPGTTHAGDARASLPDSDSLKDSPLSQRAGATENFEEDEHAFRRALAMLPRTLVTRIIAIRREREKPITGDAGETLARALRKFPDPAVAAEEMADRGWLSINARWRSQQQVVADKPAQHATSPPVDRDRAEWKRVLAEARKKNG